MNTFQLLELIKLNFEDKANWQNSLKSLNALRQLNKYYSSEMNEVCRLLWPSIQHCLESVKPVIVKTSMMFIQELLNNSGVNLQDEILQAIEQFLSLKVHSDKAFIKQEA